VTSTTLDKSFVEIKVYHNFARLALVSTTFQTFSRSVVRHTFQQLKKYNFENDVLSRKNVPGTFQLALSAGSSRLADGEGLRPRHTHRPEKLA
jgi:6,7-dimethyl-8-ribityllumazine synthase